MKIALNFNQAGQTSLHVVAELDAERSILGYMVEGTGRVWRPRHQYTYRPAGVADVIFDEHQLNPPATPVNLQTLEIGVPKFMAWLEQETDFCQWDPAVREKVRLELQRILIGASCEGRRWR